MKIITFAAAALALCGTAALAQPFESKGSTQGWNVFYNGTTGGCFMERAVGDHVVQIGTEAAMLGDGEGETFGFLAVYTKEEVALHDGDMVPIFIDIDGERFGGDAVGVERDGYHGGYVISNSAEFGDAIAAGNTMTVAPDSENATDLSLAGSSAALDAVRACQAEHAG